MKQADSLEDVPPLELANALLAAMRRHHVQCGATPAVDSQRRLDLDTLRLLDQISYDVIKIVRGLVNLHSPVGRLPAELLAEVFANVSKPYLEYTTPALNAYPFDNIRSVEDLRPLTAVCRQWRELALATPSLWSTVSVEEKLDDGRGSSYPHYLHRCTAGPIYVVIHSVRPGSTVWRLLEEMRERVRELYLAVEPGWVYAGTGSSSSVIPGHLRFPNLEHCAWIKQDTYNTSDPALRQYGFCDSPRLRTLELRRPFCIPPHAYPALTHLSIIGPCSDGDHGDLLRLLSSTPGLQALTVGRLDNLRLARSTSPHVNLPLLRHLGIQYSTSSGSWKGFQAFRNVLLSSLTIPASCTVDLGPVLAKNMPPSVAHLSQIHTATHLSIHRDWASDHLKVQFSAENGTPTVSFEVSDMPNPRSTADGAPNRAVLVATLANLAPRVRSLSVGRQCHWLFGARPHSIACVFPHLAFLRICPADGRTDRDTLPVLSNNLAYMLEALQADGIGTQPDPLAAPPVCPELTRLWIDWPAVTHDFEAADDSAVDKLHFQTSGPVYDRPPTTILDSLRRLADARAARGHPLSRVFITYSRLVKLGRSLDCFACTADEYDGSITRVLRSAEVDWDTYDTASRLEAFIARKWEGVQDAS